MERLIEWYWRYGVQRGQDPEDPNRESRKVRVGSWLDPVSKIVRRTVKIAANANARPCAAIWGPSQTGKSTLLSQYLDGDQLDGSDSALTWDSSRPVRFSLNLTATASNVPPSTLVFNPHHAGSDASGVTTRYTIIPPPNPQYPVRLELSSRAQIMHAFSRGFFSQCRFNPVNYETASWQERLQRIDAQVTGNATSREAYEWMRDIVDVIELMQNSVQFNPLFNRTHDPVLDWERAVRPSLINSIGSVAEAQRFAREIFWDGSQKVSAVFEEVLRMRDALAQKWKNAPVYLSLEVASLLVDIASFKDYHTEAQDEQSRTRLDQLRVKIQKVKWQRSNDGSSIVIGIDPQAGSQEISGDHFGYFQALAGELVVSLRKDALQSERKRNFRVFIENHDILDFPGLSHINRGGVTSDESLYDTEDSNVTDVKLLTEVYKEGKTLGCIENYIREFGIDAFIILVRSQSAPSKFDLLENGIQTWIHSFPSSHPPRVFVNMTFFGTVINSVAVNGIQAGFADDIVGRIEQLLPFTRSARWFLTNYAQFPDGRLPNNPNPLLKTLSEALGERLRLASEGFNAAIAPDGGTEYMFGELSSEIETASRKVVCRCLVVENWKKLKPLLTPLLPQAGENEDRSENLNRLAHAVESRIEEIEANGTANEYTPIAQAFKELFFVPVDALDPIPRNLRTVKFETVLDYVRRQCVKWYDSKLVSIRNTSVLPQPEAQIFLEVLRENVDSHALATVLRAAPFGGISNQDTALSMRAAFALLLGNQLLTGTNTRVAQNVANGDVGAFLERLLQNSFNGSRRKEDNPGYLLAIKPALERIHALADHSETVKRRPQPGDSELQQIIAELNTQIIHQ